MTESTNAEIFILENGDGDPDFIHQRHEVRFVSEPWFPSKIMEQDAQLLLVISGSHQGRYVAITQRGGSIDTQIRGGGFAGVIARPIRNPTLSFDETVDLEIGGMTILRRVGDERFAK